MQRLEELERANEEFARRLETLAEENQSLSTNRGGPLEGGSGAAHHGHTRRELDLMQPPDIRTTEPYTETAHSDDPANPFEEALLWSSEDDEWTLNFHNETQLDIRTYGQAHSDPVNQFGIGIARMRMIFNGRLTKPIEYNVSINKGGGSLDLLDAYLNFDYDTRFQLRIGRYRVPFTYDWFALSNQFLATPERSVFALNYGYNRNTGVMLHGDLLEGAVDYALGAVNGPRNSYFDNNSDKDLLAYLNVRPFYHAANWPGLKHLNMGGSYGNGKQDQSPQPVNFHTSSSASSSGGTTVGVPSFLQLNNNVVERGLREQWEFHIAYYYKQLTIQAAIDRGLNTYAFTDAAGSVPLHVRAWHAQFGYFLTGEEITRRTFVDVLRPFDLRAGRRGPGAWELQARFDHFELSNDVFTGGLADPTQWTNSVDTIDCGLNWYLNRYVKIDLDWQHAIYDDPVRYNVGRLSKSNDLFWVRFQTNF